MWYASKADGTATVAENVAMRRGGGWRFRAGYGARTRLALLAGLAEQAKPCHLRARSAQVPSGA